ncbi:MAG: arsenate reductase ArsC [Deltaproteobacteria bacterium]|nr:arsenate reductase ArsC [Deltaproteobacteria bacterium]
MTKKIAFICTGNSCRSQMAEGFAKKILGKRWKVYSAGVAHSHMQPKTVEVMKEVGVDISNQYSKGLDAIPPLKEIDYFVTLCGYAKDHCPVLPHDVTKEHWPIDDPFRYGGNEEKLLEKYREVRDDIEKRVQEFKKRIGG